MLLPAECDRCGGAKMEHGRLTGAAFTPRDTPALKFGDTSTSAVADLPITASACVSCGCIVLTTDLTALMNRTGHKPPTMPQPAQPKMRFRPAD